MKIITQSDLNRLRIYLEKNKESVQKRVTEIENSKLPTPIENMGKITRDQMNEIYKYENNNTL